MSDDTLVAGFGVVGVGLLGLVAWLVATDDDPATVPAFDGDSSTSVDVSDPSGERPATGEDSLARQIGLTGELPTGNDVASRIGLVGRQQSNDVEEGFTGL